MKPGRGGAMDFCPSWVEGFLALCLSALSPSGPWHGHFMHHRSSQNIYSGPKDTMPYTSAQMLHLFSHPASKWCSTDNFRLKRSCIYVYIYIQKGQWGCGGPLLPDRLCHMDVLKLFSSLGGRLVLLPFWKWGFIDFFRKVPTEYSYAENRVVCCPQAVLPQFGIPSMSRPEAKLCSSPKHIELNSIKHLGEHSLVLNMQKI